MHRTAIYIGFDPREAAAFAIARDTMRRNLNSPIPIYGLVLSNLQKAGLYTRPTSIKINGDGRPEMVDHLSIRSDYDGRISTEHAIARFLVPIINGPGMAVFCDGDTFCRKRVNVGDLFWQASKDPSKALWCVQHDHRPTNTDKMDGQVQTAYERKNWSSVMLFNCDHPANQELTLEMVNTLPGRDLHRFCWLDDTEIGAFGAEWNHLVGYSDPAVDAKIVHFTDGLPNMAGYENVPFADEWRDRLTDWAQGALSLPG